MHFQDDIDLAHHLRYLDWVNDNSNLESDDDTSSSDDSEILGTLNSQATVALDKSMEEESWV